MRIPIRVEQFWCSLKWLCKLRLHVWWPLYNQAGNLPHKLAMCCLRQGCHAGKLIDAKEFFDKARTRNQVYLIGPSKD